MSKVSIGMAAIARARKTAILAFLEAQSEPVVVSEIAAATGDKQTTLRSCLDRLVKCHLVTSRVEYGRLGVPIVRVYSFGGSNGDPSEQKNATVTTYPLNHKRDALVAALFGERTAA